MFDFNFNYLGKYYLDRLKNIDTEKVSEETLLKSVKQVAKYNKKSKYGAAYYKGIQDGIFGKTSNTDYENETDQIVILMYKTAYNFISEKFKNNM